MHQILVGGEVLISGEEVSIVGYKFYGNIEVLMLVSILEKVPYPFWFIMTMESNIQEGM